jgi:FkbM family methyltransferase
LEKLNRLIRVILVGLPLAVLCLIGVGQARQWHVLLVASHHLNGRAGICTLTQSFQGVRISQMQLFESDRLARASRLLETDARGFKRWDTTHGIFWVPANSEEAVAYDLAEQERDIYGKGETGVHAGDVVLDCGANIGVFTRKALDLGARRVIAIEPAPENVECLRRNFAAEIAQGRVLVYPKGVWNKEDVLELKVDPKNSAKDTFVRASDPAVKYDHVRVPLTTVDQLTRELKLERVDFIKMDIEGAEQKAIAGARQTIAKNKPRMALCVYHLPEDQVMVPKLVREISPGYRLGIQCLCAPEMVQAQVAHFY